MKNNLIHAIKYVSVFGCCIICFCLLLVLVCMIPSNLVYDKVHQSSEVLTKEGPNYMLVEMLGICTNTQTDAVIVNETYSVDSNHPFLSALIGRKNYNPEYTIETIEENVGEGITANFNEETKFEEVDDKYNSIGELSDFLDGKIHTAIYYGRYWHGNWVLFRPLFVLFNISQIRTILLILFAILFSILAFIINKKYGLNIAIIYGASLVLSSYFSASYSLESSPIFLVTMISTIILLLIKDKIKNPYLFFFVIGMIVNYVDYFTVPLIPFFVPFSLLLLDYMKEHDLKECFVYMIKAGINYGFGYALTWVMKWALFDVFVPANNSVLAIGIKQSLYRMSRENSYILPEYDLSYFIGGTIFRYIIYVAIIYIVISIVKDIGTSGKKTGKKVMAEFSKVNYLFLLIALSPLAWFVMVKNHTLLHFYFTFRMYVIMMIGLLLFLNNAFLKE